MWMKKWKLFHAYKWLYFNKIFYFFLNKLKRFVNLEPNFLIFKLICSFSLAIHFAFVLDSQASVVPLFCWSSQLTMSCCVSLISSPANKYLSPNSHHYLKIIRLRSPDDNRYLIEKVAYLRRLLHISAVYNSCRYKSLIICLL